MTSTGCSPRPTPRRPQGDRPGLPPRRPPGAARAPAPASPASRRSLTHEPRYRLHREEARRSAPSVPRSPSLYKDADTAHRRRQERPRSHEAIKAANLELADLVDKFEPIQDAYVAQQDNGTALKAMGDQRQVDRPDRRSARSVDRRLLADDGAREGPQVARRDARRRHGGPRPQVVRDGFRGELPRRARRSAASRRSSPRRT